MGASLYGPYALPGLRLPSAALRYTVVAFPGVLHDDWMEIGPPGGWTTTLPIATDASLLQPNTAFMSTDVLGDSVPEWVRSAVARSWGGKGLAQGPKTRFTLVHAGSKTAHVTVGGGGPAARQHKYQTNSSSYGTRIEFDEILIQFAEDLWESGDSIRLLSYTLSRPVLSRAEPPPSSQWRMGLPLGLAEV